ncbi:small neutral protease regulatory protein [Actinorhabdospora filicis]|uniref:Small neutral protease regulatory protein n=1 Tax=Actinorhabdospora filicis TaxID=1785913 RepID=A0A9W6SHC1_9ACTN|nr:LysR family transcriptional regulator [Actinorhabdospora filicis]GLZ77140.1 small neutral protease regulatory protein [Actinorhabdospora filicis]
MDLELRHLRAVCAIADAGSLTKAAARLGVSQPALSAQLRRVERVLGGELFDRGRGGAWPTTLGVRTLERVRPLLAEFDAFLGGAGRDAGSGPRSLRMGSAHMECVGTMIALVRGSLSDVDFRLQVEPSALTLTQGLEHDRLDLAVIGSVDDHEPPVPPGVIRRVLVPRVPVLLAISGRHRLAARDEIDLAELAGEDWICPPGPDDGSLSSLRDACRRAGFEPRVSYQVPSGGGRQLIESGQAVELVEPTSIGLGGLIVKRLKGDPMGMRISLAWRAGRLSPDEADVVYRAIAEAYTIHARGNPVFAAWWAAHPEVHPYAGT